MAGGCIYKSTKYPPRYQNDSLCSGNIYKQNKYLFWSAFQHWNNWPAMGSNYKCLFNTGRQRFHHIILQRNAKASNLVSLVGQRKLKIMPESQWCYRYGHKCPWLWWIWGLPSTSRQLLLNVPWAFLRAQEYINAHLPSQPTTLSLGIHWASSMFSESLLKRVHSSVSLFLSLSKKLPSPKLQNSETSPCSIISSLPKITQK